MITLPPYLKQGDCIGILCPSGYMQWDKAQSCIKALQQWGFEVKPGKTLGSQFHYFSGTDKERLADLQTMLDDEHIKAILCARGGYGLSRIIDAIDFSAFKRNPKWIIGYSDITVLHAHLHTVLQTASLHAPMAAAFNDGDNSYIGSLHDALLGKPTNYSCQSSNLNRNGVAEGLLVGGNLSIIAHLIGSPSSFNTKDKILFLEDVGEYLYNIDRMMMQLERAGMLHGLSALILGSFTEMKDTVIPFGQQVYELVYDKVKAYNYPVCFGFPVGHTTENLALKVGAAYRLVVDSTTTLSAI